MATIHDIFNREMGIPRRLVVDRSSEFTAMDTRALADSELGVRMTFIPVFGAPSTVFTT